MHTRHANPFHPIPLKAALAVCCGALALGFLASAFRADAGGPPGDAASGGGPAVSLEMGLSLSDEGIRAAFVLTNPRTQPFRTTPVGTNYNRLVIVAPDGKIHERFTWKDGIPEVVVPPSGSHTWRLDLGKMPEFEAPGLYRLRWKVGEIESAQIVVVREEKTSES